MKVPVCLFVNYAMRRVVVVVSGWGAFHQGSRGSILKSYAGVKSYYAMHERPHRGD
jgi:hypothetical protein